MSSVPHRFSARRFPQALATQALDEALASGQRVPVLAISGLQGSGKSTLAAQVVELARTRGLRAAALSIDDVYLTRAQRQRLADRVHPLLATRGPGTRLYCCGPAGGGGVRTSLRPRLNMLSCTVPREAVAAGWSFLEALA